MPIQRTREFRAPPLDIEILRTGTLLSDHETRHRLGGADTLRVPLWFTAKQSDVGCCTSRGDVPGVLVGWGDSGRTPFAIPSGFTNLVSTTLMTIARSTKVDADIDLDSDYGENTQGYATHSEAEVAATYNITTDQNFDFDVSGLLPDLVAGDRGGIKLTCQENITMIIVGLLMIVE